MGCEKQGQLSVKNRVGNAEFVLDSYFALPAERQMMLLFSFVTFSFSFRIIAALLYIKPDNPHIYLSTLLNKLRDDFPGISGFFLVSFLLQIIYSIACKEIFLCNAIPVDFFL